MSISVTVFTPTYNRGYIIQNLYESLRSQTNKNFEWIVIDDGSADNTEMLFQKWLLEDNGFEIKYCKVENGGKHRAINKAVDMASAEAFFIVDSDDYLLDKAIDKVIDWFETIRKNDSFAGISGLRGKTEKYPIGGWGNFDSSYIDITNLEREKYGLLRDKAEVYKTSILKKYRFPEYDGENFITEGVVWNAIARDGYKLRWYKEIIYICDYREDGLTKNGRAKWINNPAGTMAYINLSEQLYGEEYAKKSKFRFYFVLRNRYEKKKVQEIMKIDSSLTEELETKYMLFLKELEEYFAAHNIKNVAVYGLGNVGSTFLEIAPKVHINVRYGIDQQKKDMNALKVVYPQDEFEEVDAIVITLMNHNTEVEKKLKEKMGTVVYWRDISSEYWYV
ncbi:MAG: glycosyltransferase family 2 protein [Lachnospiraceae bacterium]|nr:glycosyltransferase family 2 protein [Lachnospiraceae bacterium]